MLRIKKSVLLPILLAAITLLLLMVARLHPQWVEQYYSTQVYWWIVQPLSVLSGFVPFSVSDIFYVVLILWIPATIIALFLRKISIKKAFIRLVQLLCYSFAAFYFLWGFNYYRSSTAHRFNLHIEKENKASAFKKAFAKTIENANYYRQQVTDSVDLKLCDKSIDSSYRKLEKQLHLKYWNAATTTKQMTFSGIFAKGGILGIYGPFFGEVHINKNFTKWGYPITRAHEMAHRFGLAGEADANFYAWYVCSHSNNNWNRYCANFFALRYFISKAERVGDCTEMFGEIDRKIWDDIKANQDYWRSKMNVTVRKVTTKANDMYLKSNNVKRGVADYGGVLELIIAEMNKE